MVPDNKPARQDQHLTQRGPVRLHRRGKAASGAQARHDNACRRLCGKTFPRKRERIQGSDEAQAWRLAHLAEYRSARSWMILAADLVVDTGCRTASAVAHQIADSLPIP
jgi:hypothetical protein